MSGRGKLKGFRFTLRVKLLLLSVAILTLPYIAYDYMRETELRLRSNLEASLLNAAGVIAATLHQNYRLFPDSNAEIDSTFFIHQLDTPFTILNGQRFTHSR